MYNAASRSAAGEIRKSKAMAPTWEARLDGCILPVFTSLCSKP